MGEFIDDVSEWYVDCFEAAHRVQEPGRPFASYGPHTLAEAGQVMRNVLLRPASEMVRVEIGRETKGHTPRKDRSVQGDATVLAACNQDVLRVIEVLSPAQAGFLLREIRRLRQFALAMAGQGAREPEGW